MAQTDIHNGETKKTSIKYILTHFSMEFILLALVIFLIFFAPGFATGNNLLNVLRTVSMLGIIAYGMTAVIVSGEIDLSVGSAVALSGCIVAWFADGFSDSIGGWPATILGITVAIIVGFSLGFMTGKFRQWFNVPSFITTLALFATLRGVANLITGGFPISSFPDGFGFLGGGNIFGIPFPVFCFIFVFIGMQFLMNYTSFGRSVYAVGGNMEAARLSGIDIWRVKAVTLGLTGALAAISGTLIASQIGSASGTTATGMELDVIAAVIVGGTSLFGGKGRIWGTFVGVIFLGCISNGMVLMNVSEYWQYVARGAIILGAVLLNQMLEKAQ